MRYATHFAVIAALACALAHGAPVAAQEPPADDGAEALQKAVDAARAARRDDADSVKSALQAATAAIEANPKSTAAYRLRAQIHEVLTGDHQRAVDDYTSLLRLDPTQAAIYDRRGSEQFKLGNVEESVADFDRAVELDPARGPGHWKRGISYYYVGRFADGAKQFEAYQTTDDNDVENAVWRYLCMAREVGVEKARADILNIKQDRRVPMMEVHALYAGKVQPADVLAAAKAGEPDAEALNRRLFYAHLYLGLYYDAAGDKEQALQHVTEAEKHKIGHYMWDVAHVHAELLRRAAEK